MAPVKSIALPISYKTATIATKANPAANILPKVAIKGPAIAINLLNPAPKIVNKLAPVSISLPINCCILVNTSEKILFIPVACCATSVATPCLATALLVICAAVLALIAVVSAVIAVVLAVVAAAADPSTTIP